MNEERSTECKIQLLRPKAVFYTYTDKEMRELSQATDAIECLHDIISYIEELRVNEDNSKEVQDIIDIILEYIYADCEHRVLPMN